MANNIEMPKAHEKPRKPTSFLSASNVDSRVDKRPKKKPASFLSLPLELRQSILFQSCDPKKEMQWVYMTTAPALVLYYIELNTGVRPSRFPTPAAKHINSWCKDLVCAHPTIKQDLVYVKEKWVKELKEIEELKESKKLEDDESIES